MRVRKKREGFGLKSITKRGEKGNYLFFKTPYGSYNAFLEVATKDAARDCGATGEGNTRQLCKKYVVSEGE